LEYAILMYGKPECLRSDNGPEFMSRATTLWKIEKGIDQSLINPGKPIENSIVECFNGRFRYEFLNENLFLNTEEARKKLAEWRVHYNTKRPYSSLRNKTPEEFWLEFEDGLTELVG
jgi:putative transposase